MKTIIFCVNYNSYNEAENYLSSLEKAVVNSDVELTVVVADNSAKVEPIKSDYSFELIHLPTNGNLGYFGGAIYGIRNCNKVLSDYDYCIISNVDLSVSDDFFSILSSISIDRGVGCIAPQIYSSGENRDRNPKVLERYSAKKLKILRMMYKFPVLDHLYTSILFRKRRQSVENSTKEIIYAAHGSFMLFTKEFSAFLQTMEYPVFMFGEEIFIAEHLRKLDLKTVYNPRLKINDTDHVSTSKMKSAFYYKCNYEAIDMLIKEFFNE